MAWKLWWNYWRIFAKEKLERRKEGRKKEGRKVGKLADQTACLGIAEMASLTSAASWPKSDSLRPMLWKEKSDSFTFSSDIYMYVYHDVYTQRDT